MQTHSHLTLTQSFTSLKNPPGLGSNIRNLSCRAQSVPTLFPTFSHSRNSNSLNSSHPPGLKSMILATNIWPAFSLSHTAQSLPKLISTLSHSHLTLTQSLTHHSHPPDLDCKQFIGLLPTHNRSGSLSPHTHTHTHTVSHTPLTFRDLGCNHSIGLTIIQAHSHPPLNLFNSLITHLALGVKSVILAANTSSVFLPSRTA